MAPFEPVRLGLFTKVFLAAVAGVFSLCAAVEFAKGNFGISAALMLWGVVPPSAIVLMVVFFNRHPIELKEEDHGKIGILGWAVWSREYSKQQPGWPAFVIKYGLGGAMLLGIGYRLTELVLALLRSN